MKIFISYCHQNKSLAKKIWQDLSYMGIQTVVDEKNLKYTENIKDYMKQIRTNDFSLVLISDDYLKSYSCMFEISELIKELNYKELFLPVVVDDYLDGEIFKKGAKIYDKLESINYIEFWENEHKKLKKRLKKIELDNIGSLYQELRTLREISLNMGDFLIFLRNRLNVQYDQLILDNYQILLERINFKDKSKDLRRAKVSFGQASFEFDLNKKLELLNHSIELNSDFEEAYSHRAILKADLGLYPDAIKDFTKAIELNPNKWTNYTNRGQTFQDLGLSDNALIDFNKAIELNPEDGLAYNNRANMYRENGNLDLALSDVNKAILLEPDYERPYSTLSEIYLCKGNKEGFFSNMEKAVLLGFPLYKHLEDGLYNKYEKDDRFIKMVESSRATIGLK